MSDRRQHAGELIRFLTVGAANTALTAGVFYLLADVLTAAVAYAAAYVLGIVVAGALVPTLVFRRPPAFDRSVRVAGGYLLVLVLGAVLAATLDDAGFSRAAVVIISLGVTVPANFIVARLLVNRTHRRDARG